MRELIPASPQYYFHFPDSHVFNFVECNLEYSHQSPGEMERIETGSGAQLGNFERGAQVYLLQEG